GVRRLKPLMEIESRAGGRQMRPSAHDAEPFIDRVIRKQSWMDGVAEAIQRAIGSIYGSLGAPGRALSDLLHGTTLLGHSLHAALTDVPLGAWTVGVLADWAGMATGGVSRQG